MTRLPKTLGGIELRSFAMSCFTIFAILTSHASAVVILNSDGTANNGQTSAAGTTAPYDNVGIRGSSGATVVYLGNDWAITADHVNTNTGGVGPLQIGGNDYNVDNTIQLTNPYDSSLADLKLVHIVTGGANPPAPLLSNLQIATSSPGLGDQVEMVGNGQNLNVDGITGLPVQYYWSVTGPPLSPTWTQTTSPGNASGYETTSGNTIRYGDNNISTVTNPVPVNDGSPYTVTAFQTTFINTYYTGGTAYPDEAQATSGDSGGAVFSFVGGQWVLSGIMVAEATYANQPTNVTPTVSNGSGTAVFGDESYIADLSVYRSEILAIVPEPSSVVLAALGGIGLVIAAVRRRRAACPR